MRKPWMASEGVPSREKAILGLGHWGGGGHRFASKNSSDMIILFIDLQHMF